jgi:hypothetical protein
LSHVLGHLRIIFLSSKLWIFLSTLILMCIPIQWKNTNDITCSYASCNNDSRLRFKVILQWNIKLLFTFKCLYIHDCNKICNTYHKVKSSYNSNFFPFNIYFVPKKLCLISKWIQHRNKNLTWKSLKYKTIKLSHMHIAKHHQIAPINPILIRFV